MEDRIEPGILAEGLTPESHRVLLTSIAISLKRIADALEIAPSGDNLANAIEGAISRGLNRG